MGGTEGRDMIPRTTETTPPIDISKVIDLALEYNPNLAMAELSTIRMWTNEVRTESLRKKSGLPAPRLSSGAPGLPAEGIGTRCERDRHSRRREGKGKKGTESIGNEWHSARTTLPV